MRLFRFKGINYPYDINSNYGIRGNSAFLYGCDYFELHQENDIVYFFNKKNNSRIECIKEESMIDNMLESIKHLNPIEKLKIIRPVTAITEKLYKLI
jgi:hypothetical protein